MLQVNNVSVVFEGFDGRPVQALRPIDFALQTGDFVSVIGPNGSGKSTLLNALAGAVPLASGRIVLDGAEIQNLPAFSRAAVLSRVFQNPLQGTAADLTVAENFRLALLRGKPKQPWFSLPRNWEQQARAKIASLQLGLEEKWTQQMGSLSGGQRQALTLVMATIAGSKLLLLDEPVAALDPASATVVMQTAVRIAKEENLTVFHITHKLADAVSFGNKLMVMHLGACVASFNGTEKEALSATGLEQQFFQR